jgi:hypothetical protein
MPRPSPGVVAACVAACAAPLVAGGFGCSAWQRVPPAPLVEIGFGAGVRVPRRADDRPLVSTQATAGGVSWWRREAEGPGRQYFGLGGVATVAWFDLDRVDVGAELVVAPPRTDRRTGFQLRTGLRTSGLDHVTPLIAAEWSDAFVGALFVEAGYDWPGDEAAFVVGARINLFWPVTLVRTELIAE